MEELTLKGVREEILHAVGEFQKAAQADIKTTQSDLAEIKSNLEKINDKTALDNLKAQVEALKAEFLRPGGQAAGGGELKSAGRRFIESEGYKDAKAHDFRFATSRQKIFLDGPAFPLPSSQKSTITDAALGTQTTGVIPLVRIPGVLELARIDLRIRDRVRVLALTAGNAVDWVKQATRVSGASPQGGEGVTKGESTYTWTSATAAVKTIGHFTNVSRQALDDVDWLRSEIDTELMYGLKLKEETEILAGDGLGDHLSGIITQATAYNTALNVASDTMLDKLRHAKLQARLLGLGTYAPDTFVLSPTDVEKLELIKDETGGANKGRYIVGDPKTGAPVMMVWGLPVVESDSMSTGQFLVGNFARGVTLFDRMAASIDISFEHANNFTQNLATILCEERIALAVQRPDAFVVGLF